MHAVLTASATIEGFNYQLSTSTDRAVGRRHPKHELGRPVTPVTVWSASYVRSDSSLIRILALACWQLPTNTVGASGSQL
jgi:hypothetical protein